MHHGHSGGCGLAGARILVHCSRGGHLVITSTLTGAAVTLEGHETATLLGHQVPLHQQLSPTHVHGPAHPEWLGWLLSSLITAKGSMHGKLCSVKLSIWRDTGYSGHTLAKATWTCLKGRESRLSHAPQGGNPFDHHHLCLQRGRASPRTQDTPRESRSKMGLSFHMILSRPTISLQVLLTGTC